MSDDTDKTFFQGNVSYTKYINQLFRTLQVEKLDYASISKFFTLLFQTVPDETIMDSLYKTYNTEDLTIANMQETDLKITYNKTNLSLYLKKFFLKDSKYLDVDTIYKYINNIITESKNNDKQNIYLKEFTIDILQTYIKNKLNIDDIDKVPFDDFLNLLITLIDNAN